MFLLDTTVLIDALRRHPPTLARLQAAGVAFLVSAISVEEVLAAMRRGEEERTHDLIAGLEVVPVGLEEAFVAGRWRREFRDRGITLGDSDCLIAACAATNGAILATANVKDFPMPELHVEHWPSGD